MERAGKMQITHENGIDKIARIKSYGQIKIFTEIRANFLCIFALSFNKLEGPLRMLGFVPIFFGSSPVVTEWDKIVPEIIHTTLVFLGHPNGVQYLKILPPEFFLHAH